MYDRFTFSRSYRGPLQAIILDWAGTILDFGSCAPAAAFVEVFKREGVEVTTEEARGPMGSHKRDHIRQMTETESVAKRWQAVHDSAATEEDVTRMYDEFVPIQLAGLAGHADLVPGCLEAIEAFRSRNLKIGTSTGYSTEMIEIVCAEAKERGFEPDAVVCATDVPAGRPAPWMCFENAQRLGVYPMESVVKVDDTLPGIVAGLNAGMWSIGVVKTGNEIGLTEKEIAALPADDYQRRIKRAYTRMHQAGAHYVVDGIADVPGCLDDIQRRLAAGERP